MSRYDRSVNAEVILIHESNSKNNLKQVVNMADSTSSTDQSDLLHQTDGQDREAETPEKRRIRLDRDKSYREK